MNDKSEISVKDALRKGNWYVKFPSYIILLGLVITPLLLFNEDEDPKWIFATFILSSFSLSILYLQIAKPKWKIWAYSNVRNLHLLEKRAIEDDIIYSRSSKWTRYEIMSQADRKKLEELYKNFDLEDEYTDNNDIPSETLLKRATKLNYLYLIFWILVFCACLYLTIFTTAFGFGIIMGLCSISFGYTQFKEIRYNRFYNNNVFLRINDKGIETEVLSFISWDRIEHIDLHGAYSGAKYPFISMIYETEKGDFEYVIIDVDRFEIPIRTLEERLRIYKQRYKNQRQTFN